mgnify:FL=1
MTYDIIIVGSGLGGLSAGICLAKQGKKVLILEKNNIPGGLVTTFKVGRYEFDTSMYELYDYGTSEHVGALQDILNDFHVDFHTSLALNTKIYYEDTKEFLEIKENIEDLFLELESRKSGSIEPLRDLLKVVKEIKEAQDALLNNDFLEEDYPSFMKYLTYNASDALIDLKIPKETIDRISYVCLYLGSPLKKLSFIDLACFLYTYIFKKVVISTDKNLNFIFQLLKEYKASDGKIEYESKVTKIEDKEQYIEVITNNKTYRASKVICDLPIRYVYKELIDDKEKYPLCNAKTYSPSTFMVFLGLNKDYQTIGFNNYHYIHMNSNSNKVYKDMNNLFHSNWEAYVPNVIQEYASPKGTTIMTFKISFNSDAWNKVTEKDYATLKEQVASHIIQEFEETFKIDVKEYIEEIEIASPLTISRYSNSVNGTIMGSMRIGYDNVINRVLDKENNDRIYFVGADSYLGGGIHNTILNGTLVAKEITRKED